MTESALGVHRKDIDGLRALAVLPVVLFHADVPGFSGGFVGVDVFFVISGYLITRILLADNAAGRISIWKFYERRIRRICPALFVVLAFCCLIAPLLLTPYDMIEFAKELFATSLFASNLYFWRGWDYFLAIDSVRPLIHTWSLAVEEQFYIAYPLLLALLFRWRPRWPARVILILALLSLGMSEFAVHQWPQAAFFLPVSRGWELLAGGYLATGAVPKIRNARIAEAMSVLGLACIAVAVFAYSEKTPIPGISMLLPCAGAMLLLHANAGRTTVTGSWLGTPPLVFPGLISYSLYLWHWPILLFARLALLRDLQPWETAMLIAAAFLAATLSWRFIEQPFRRPEGVVRRRGVFVASGAATALFLMLGTAGALSGGWPQRFDRETTAMYAYSRYMLTPEFARANRLGTCLTGLRYNYAYDQAECFTVRPGERNILLWGDSIAAQFSLPLREALTGRGVNVMQATFLGCAPFLRVDRALPTPCDRFNDRVISRLASQTPDSVILVGHWRYDRDGSFPFDDLDATVALLRSRGIHVYLLGPTQAYARGLPEMLAQTMWRGQDPRTVNPSLRRGLMLFEHAMREHYAGQPGVTYVSVMDTICPAENCPTMIGDAPFSWSPAHFTYPASRVVIAKLLAGPLHDIDPARAP